MSNRSMRRPPLLPTLGNRRPGSEASIMRLAPVALVLTLVVSAGCSASASGSAAPTGPLRGTDDVRARGEPGRWRVFKTAQPLGRYSGLTAGSDNAVWVATQGYSGLIRVATDGTSRAVPAPITPSYVAAGSDGKLYLAQEFNQSNSYDAAVGVMTTSGALEHVYGFKRSPSGDTFYNTNIAAGPDGNVWLAETTHLASISPSGAIREYAFPAALRRARMFNEKSAVSAGPHGKIWLALCCSNSQNTYLAGFDPKTQRFAPVMAIPSSHCVYPAGLAANRTDMYVGCGYGLPTFLLRVAPGGALVRIPISRSYSSYQESDTVATGPDGRIYVTPGSPTTLDGYDPLRGVLTEHVPPGVGSSGLTGVTVGPDGNIWTIDASRSTLDVYVVDQ
jgi:hypothetical protein